VETPWYLHNKMISILDLDGTDAFFSPFTNVLLFGSCS